MFTNQTDELQYLASLGFAVDPQNTIVHSIDEAWEYAQHISQKRDVLKYPIDGVVVKINNNQIHNMLGSVGKTPRGWCAIKFPAEETTSKLCAIHWYVGRTGKLTPVAEIEPIDIDGTTVKRASLHNYKQVLEYNVSIGDLLVIRKAGDIIPEVVQVIKLSS